MDNFWTKSKKKFASVIAFHRGMYIIWGIMFYKHISSYGMVFTLTIGTDQYEQKV